MHFLFQIRTVVTNCGLNCIFLIINEVGQLFVINHLYFISEESLFRSFIRLFYWFDNSFIHTWEFVIYF